MRALLDVNVLIALLDADHAFHQASWNWFEPNAKDGWASCPITQNGCIRIMAHPAYPNALPVQAVAERIRQATATALHEFWADDATLLDPHAFKLDRVHGPLQVTDAYLLGLAVQRGGRLVTFDRAVSRACVSHAQTKHLLVL
jgi:toxin-antitoxin system PIN domain toxin